MVARLREGYVEQEAITGPQLYRASHNTKELDPENAFLPVIYLYQVSYLTSFLE